MMAAVKSSPGRRLPRTPWQAMTRTSRRQREWLKAAVTLIVVAVVIGYWWHLKHPPKQESPGMTVGTVVKSQPSDGGLSLTVDYTVRGTRHQLTGTVDKTRFRQDGKTVWVCYNLRQPGDTDKARLRLPTDPLCDQSTSGTSK